MDYKKIKIVVADMDGTLTLSKTAMDSEMADLIIEVLKTRSFAVISGSFFPQFEKQFIKTLSERSKDLKNLYLFPANATAMYSYDGKHWKKNYAERLSEETKSAIIKAFDRALLESDFKKPEKLYGPQIEDRDTQISFSALGQDAPLELKSVYDPDTNKRRKIISYLKRHLPSGVEPKIGGTTTIDITATGIDKAYGIKKIHEKLGYTIREMLFLGDKLEEGGNDYPVLGTGVECIAVSGPEETKRLLRAIIASSR